MRPTDTMRENARKYALQEPFRTVDRAIIRNRGNGYPVVATVHAARRCGADNSSHGTAVSSVSASRIVHL